MTVGRNYLRVTAPSPRKLNMNADDILHANPLLIVPQSSINFDSIIKDEDDKTHKRVLSQVACRSINTNGFMGALRLLVAWVVHYPGFLNCASQGVSHNFRTLRNNGQISFGRAFWFRNFGFPFF